MNEAELEGPDILAATLPDRWRDHSPDECRSLSQPPSEKDALLRVFRTELCGAARMYRLVMATLLGKPGSPFLIRLIHHFG
jgi:hypothetical protein